MRFILSICCIILLLDIGVDLSILNDPDPIVRYITYVSLPAHFINLGYIIWSTYEFNL